MNPEATTAGVIAAVLWVMFAFIVLWTYRPREMAAVGFLLWFVAFAVGGGVSWSLVIAATWPNPLAAAAEVMLMLIIWYVLRQNP